MQPHGYIHSSVHRLTAICGSLLTGHWRGKWGMDRTVWLRVLCQKHKTAACTAVHDSPQKMPKGWTQTHTFHYSHFTYIIKMTIVLHTRGQNHREKHCLSWKDTATLRLSPWARKMEVGGKPASSFLMGLAFDSTWLHQVERRTLHCQNRSSSSQKHLSWNGSVVPWAWAGCQSAYCLPLPAAASLHPTTECVDPAPRLRGLARPLWLMRCRWLSFETLWPQVFW